MEDNFRFVNCNERRSTEYRWLIARRKEGALIRGGGGDWLFVACLSNHDVLFH